MDAGHGWLIFALPPSELGVQCSGNHEEDWGSATEIHLPGGGKIGLYHPKHPTTLHSTSD